MRTRSKLAVILHADVAGSTALVQKDERLAHERIRTAFHGFSETISSFGGTTRELRGDALLATFERASDAVSAASEFQVANARRNATLDDAIRPEVRIGISLGEVVIADDTLTGPDVVIAQRIEQLAPPGGISTTAAVQQAVPRRLPFDFEDLGERHLKGFDEPVRTYAVKLRPGEDNPNPEPQPQLPREPARMRRATFALVTVVLVATGVVAWWQPWKPDFAPAAVERMAYPLPERPSIAVMPFDNFSKAKDQDYFSDGMVDDLITELSKVSGLFVIARNSTFTYKGRAVKVQRVAEDLGVRYVVEGSVRRSGDRVRINVQLVDALNGHHLWAERYDSTMADIFELQDTITGKIVAAMALELVALEQGPAQFRDRTADSAAYDAVLLGWKFLRQRRVDPENYVLAREQFEKALSLDPSYGRAHLSMAAVYWWGSWNGAESLLGVAYQEGVDRAKAYLETAMRKPSALGHRIRAEMYRWEGQFDNAIAEADRGIALDPNDGEAYRAKAAALSRAGQGVLALKNLDIAARLNPENPNWATRGMANLVLGNNEEAARLLELAVAAEPEFQHTYPWLIAAYGHLGRKAESQAAIVRLNELRASDGIVPYSLTFAVGHVNTALKRREDKERFILGLRKSGVGSGGDPDSTQRALDTLVVRTPEGYYDVKGVTTIGAEQAKALLEQGAVTFDMRGTGKWRIGHVPGAIHMDTAVGDLTEANLAKVADRNQPVCFYCAGFT